MILSPLIWVPIVGALLVVLLPASWLGRCRLVTQGVAIANFLWIIQIVLRFSFTEPGQQFQELLPWLEPLGLIYHLGVDGLSLPLLGLNGLIILVATSSTPKTLARPRLYYALMLLISGAVAGAFLSQNGLLFFLFYELELIPLYLLIAIWGGANRSYAAIKFLLYTAVSGVLILAAFFGLAWHSGLYTFEIPTLLQHGLPVAQQIPLLLLMIIGFGIKIPLVPLHTWLPDAHVEASSPVSTLLAGVLLKLGTYGMLRFGLCLFPEAWQAIAPWLASWAVVSVLYGSFTAIAQRDMKKMVAYSSIGHMGYILLAFAAATPLSLLGSVLQMVSHGLISAMLFLLVGVVYARTGTRDIDALRGLLNPERGLPLVGSLMIIGVMASAGTPGMVGFIAEFVIFRGSFAVFPVQTLLCMCGTILTAVYFLLLANRVFFGRLSETACQMTEASTLGDRVPSAALAALVILLGLQPGWLTHWSEPTTTGLALPPQPQSTAQL